MWIFSLPLPDCSLNEDNFSLRCPKHKVKKERFVLILFLWKFCLVLFTKGLFSFSFTTQFFLPPQSQTQVAGKMFLFSTFNRSNFLSSFLSLSLFHLFSSLSLPRPSGQPSQCTWSSRREAEGHGEKEEMQESGSCKLRISFCFCF